MPPYRDIGAMGILEKQQEDIRAGRILIMSTSIIDEELPIVRPPRPCAPKKLPGRKIPIGERLISYMRLVSARCDKYDYPGR